MLVTTETSTCAHCHGGFCVFIIPECNHCFHFRCCPEWPLTHCPACTKATAGIKVLDRPRPTPKLRNGKWTTEEAQYVERMIDDFLQGHVFCANGTSIRLILSRILNCSPMRLSKKFQKQALGKHSFRLPNSKKIRMNMVHLDRQHGLSNYETSFFHQVKNSSYEEFVRLVAASSEFWEQQFLAFAEYLGQHVIGYEFHLNKASRKRKRVNLSTEYTPWVHQPSKKCCISPKQSKFIPKELLPIKSELLPTDKIEFTSDFLLDIDVYPELQFAANVGSPAPSYVSTDSEPISSDEEPQPIALQDLDLSILTADEYKLADKWEDFLTTTAAAL